MRRTLFFGKVSWHQPDFCLFSTRAMFMYPNTTQLNSTHFAPTSLGCTSWPTFAHHPQAGATATTFGPFPAAGLRRVFHAPPGVLFGGMPHLRQPSPDRPVRGGQTVGGFVRFYSCAPCAPKTPPGPPQTEGLQALASTQHIVGTQ